MTDPMPELPEYHGKLADHYRIGNEIVYSAGMMIAYGQQCAAASNAEIERLLESANARAEAAESLYVELREENDRFTFARDQHFEARLAASEAREAKLRKALQRFVDHFGDPFKNALAALSAKD
jgi:hypothetical protein